MNLPAHGKLLPLLGLCLVAAVALAAGYVSPGNDDATPSTLPEETAPDENLVRGFISAVAPASLTLDTESGERTLPLAQGAVIERLRPAGLADMAPGDWLNLGAQRHDRTMFTIVGLTVIPAVRLSPP